MTKEKIIGKYLASAAYNGNNIDLNSVVELMAEDMVSLMRQITAMDNLFQEIEVKSRRGQMQKL